MLGLRCCCAGNTLGSAAGLLGRVDRAATLGDGGLVGRTGRMLEKSRGLRFEMGSGDIGGEFGGEI